MSGDAGSLRLIRRMAAAMPASLLDQWRAAQTFEPDVLVYHPKVSVACASPKGCRSRRRCRCRGRSSPRLSL
jgi:hypothetical protein